MGKTRSITVGNITIGGGAPVSVQSMTNTDTRDVQATVKQILELEAAGCDIVRLAVYDEASANAFAKIKPQVSVPLVADIQFDYKLGILSIQNGADKLRFNPGNIGNEANVRELVAVAKDYNVPIRVGVNAGSLEKELLKKYGGPAPDAMVESALKHVRILEKAGFYDTVISIKASGVRETIMAYRTVFERVDYPLHVGVTEAGRSAAGLVKSAIGIGALLAEGIGDTIRVSLTGDPTKEVKAANLILQSLGMKKTGVDIVSCPTCGRCRVDLEEIVKKVEAALPKGTDKHLKVAIMGCVVNGPGEAKEADIGIAFGESGAVIFKQGVKLTSMPLHEAIDLLIREAEAMLNEK